AHSIEEQALQQLKGAPKASGDSGLADIFRDHLTETEGHERAIRARLEAHGEGANKLKDLLMKVGGTGFLLFARAQPDTPGKHLEETRGHQRLVEQRLDALGGDPSSVKDAAMRAGALSWGTFFETHPDTPGKLAAFAFAFEHLEIAAYEELKRVAQRVEDTDT